MSGDLGKLWRAELRSSLVKSSYCWEYEPIGLNSGIWTYHDLPCFAERSLLMTAVHGQVGDLRATGLWEMRTSTVGPT